MVYGDVARRVLHRRPRRHHPGTDPEPDRRQRPTDRSARRAALVPYRLRGRRPAGAPPARHPDHRLICRRPSKNSVVDLAAPSGLVLVITGRDGEQETFVVVGWAPPAFVRCWSTTATARSSRRERSSTGIRPACSRGGYSSRSVRRGTRSEWSDRRGGRGGVENARRGIVSFQTRWNRTGREPVRGACGPSPQTPVRRRSARTGFDDVRRYRAEQIGRSRSSASVVSRHPGVVLTRAGVAGTGSLVAIQ